MQNGLAVLMSREIGIFSCRSFHPALSPPKPQIEERGPLTVSEITRKIKLLLDGAFPSVTVQGELSNFKRHTSGHLYFTLKDDSAQIQGVMWRSRVGQLSCDEMARVEVIARDRYSNDEWNLSR